MDATSSATIVNGAVNSLGSNLTTILPIVIPVAITVAVLFFGLRMVKGLGKGRH